MRQEHLGFGVFTTFVVKPIEARDVWAIALLQRHLLRTCHGAIRLGLCATDANSLRTFFDSLVLKLLTTLDVIPLSVAGVPLRCRLVVTAEGVSIDASPYNPPWREEEDIALSFFVGERPLPDVKSLSCVLSFLARRSAQQQGTQEAIFIGRDQRVLEGAWSNLFWIDRQGRLFTTKERILPGITREFVRREFTAAEKDISLAELIDDAKEMFITQSTTGVTTVNRLLLGGKSSHLSSIQGRDLAKRFHELLPMHSFPIAELRPSREWIVEQLVASMLSSSIALNDVLNDELSATPPPIALAEHSSAARASADRCAQSHSRFV